MNEYIGLDFEMGFINDMHDVMAMETAMLKYVVEYLPKHYSDELELLGATLPVINEIPSVTFFEHLIFSASHIINLTLILQMKLNCANTQKRIMTVNLYSLKSSRD